ncbi:hypothetical protein ACNPQM_22595 [Streptomyces sp. NPDC056231]|uniref:hypothetical protein n=1 Tax=Streptomyces sp. NPDC056231 TaxID=3345755 RepID=UPI003AB01CBB
MLRPPPPRPPGSATAWLRRRLGRAVLLSYVCALFVPDPGLWLRHTHAPPLGPLIHLPVSAAPCLLSLVLFSAGLRVPVRELGHVLRRPSVLLAGLVAAPGDPAAGHLPRRVPAAPHA